MHIRQLDTSTQYRGEQNLPKTKRIDRMKVSFRAVVPNEEKKESVPVSQEPYKPSAELKEAVNVAIALGRPLLLQGEPGCGKTRLAYAVAYELGLPLEEGYIKSTSRAQDLLYTYDALSRLYDAQLLTLQGKDGPQAGQTAYRDVSNYLEFGALGRAIARAKEGQRSVVLIDEIDKADLDFPNDLLLELDRLRFQVDIAPKLRYAVPKERPELRPIVFITHNEEKALPTAFLRRCIFHYVRFPETRDALQDILRLHALDEDANLTERAIDVILRLRGLELSKKPGLSELLDWVGYLQAVKASPEDLAKLPHPGVLVKQLGDQELALRDF